MGVTSIEWCDYTFNPWIGCAKVSPGCKNCYASVGTFTRFQRSKGLELWGESAARHVTSDANWRKVLSWAKAARLAGVRRRVFCASMADVFEDRRDLDSQRDRLWKLIEDTPELDWLLLTKRPENHEMVPLAWQTGSRRPKNLWLGTTVEDQARYDARIGHLLTAKWPAVRFLSYEPAIGPLRVDPGVLGCVGHLAETFGNPLVHWVIVGGESGYGARPFDIGWARAIVRQCEETGAACFVKQFGAKPRDRSLTGWPLGTKARFSPFAPRDATMAINLKDAKGGDIEEFPEDLRIRQFPG